MKTLIITQARFGSSRFPGKVLKPVAGGTMLDLHLKRLMRSKLASAVLVATTEEKESDAIAEIAKRNNCLVHHGSMNDVLDRFYQAALLHRPEVVVRVTSDCPLNDGHLIDQVLEEFFQNKSDYTSNVHPPTFPDGMDIEVFSFASLEKAWNEADTLKEREHVTPYIWDHPERFNLKNFYYKQDDSSLRVTVDYPSDLMVINELVQKLGDEAGWESYIQHLKDHPEIMKLNEQRIRNEGY